jgi:quinol-cytochrome oxidoreductase complex cytochrome b subunit
VAKGVRWARPSSAAGAIGVIAVASLSIVAVTGVWLAQHYRPGPRVEVPPNRFRIEVGGGWIHEVHVWAAIVLQAAAVALALVMVGALVRRRTGGVSRVAALASVGLAVAVVLGFVSGRDLRWNQLALWAVTVGGRFEGVWGIAFDESVRFVLVPGQGEVAPDEYRTWAVAHLVAVPILVVTAGRLTAATMLARKKTTEQILTDHPDLEAEEFDEVLRDAPSHMSR